MDDTHLTDTLRAARLPDAAQTAMEGRAPLVAHAVCCNMLVTCTDMGASFSAQHIPYASGLCCPTRLLLNRRVPYSVYHIVCSVY